MSRRLADLLVEPGSTVGVHGCPPLPRPGRRWRPAALNALAGTLRSRPDRRWRPAADRRWRLAALNALAGTLLSRPDRRWRPAVGRRRGNTRLPLHSLICYRR